MKRLMGLSILRQQNNLNGLFISIADMLHNKSCLHAATLLLSHTVPTLPSAWQIDPGTAAQGRTLPEFIAGHQNLTPLFISRKNPIIDKPQSFLGCITAINMTAAALLSGL